MEKQRIYTFICLASLLLFFQGSVIFIVETLIDHQIEESSECLDLGQQENPNKSTGPLEEETLHSPMTVERCFYLPIQLKIENGLYSFKLKTNYQENTTPPPERA